MLNTTQEVDLLIANFMFVYHEAVCAQRNQTIIKKQESNGAKKANNMGIAISLGAGVGMIVGLAMYGNPELGLVFGAGIGVVFGNIIRTK